MLTFIGDYDKHDFVLATAMLVGTAREEQVTIVTDDNRNYRYFQGEVSGVSISDADPDDGSFVIYDCHRTILPDLSEQIVVSATSLERRCIEQATDLLKFVEPHALLICYTDSGVSIRTVKNSLPVAKTFEYEDNPRRRIGWVHGGKVDLRRVDSAFLEVVGYMSSELLDVPDKDIKRIWNYLKKRG